MAAFRTFRTLRKFLAPRWLTTGDGELVGYALDIVKDAFVKRARLGLLVRFPQNPQTGEPAPADALTAMGRDRRVIAAIDETPEEYAARLLEWLDDRRTAGNPFTLMRKLAEYLGAGCMFRTVDVRGNWYTRAVDGTETSLLKQGNWNWDGDLSGTRWSRFWVIIYPPASLWTVNTGQGWGDPTVQGWGDLGKTWGTTATPGEVDTVQFIVNDWKPAGTRCVNIIVAFDPASFDPATPEPDGTWGRWSKIVDGVRVRSRLSTARYWDGS